MRADTCGVDDRLRRDQPGQGGGSVGAIEERTVTLRSGVATALCRDRQARRLHPGGLRARVRGVLTVLRTPPALPAPVAPRPGADTARPSVRRGQPGRLSDQ